jgi:hypothetical protein
MKNNVDAEEKTNTYLKTSVLLIIFNRPDTTEQVFGMLRMIKPKRLYIAADGPRKHKDKEEFLCAKTREIVSMIDWECDVKRKYREENVGCKRNMSEAITWFFENEEEGIILEDDCLPDPTFFTFCEELLLKYKNVDKVKMISGNNFQFGKKYGNDSYYFSNIPSIWGWATWRRAWNDYDIDMKSYPEFKNKNIIATIFDDKNIQRFWNNIFYKLYKNKMNTWAGRWVYAIYNAGGVSILPSVNLVTNVGFGKDATHTKMDNILGSIKTEPINNIIHPSNVVVNNDADTVLFYNIFYRPLHRRIFDKLKSFAKV